MQEKITLNFNDLNTIMEVLKEFEINHFTIIKNGDSGIGYDVDLQFTADFKGKMATICIPITTTDNW